MCQQTLQRVSALPGPPLWSSGQSFWLQIQQFWWYKVEDKFRFVIREQNILNATGLEIM
jgi:hypothetical protein